MPTFVRWFAAAFMLMFFASHTAVAGVACGAEAVVKQQLAAKYHEARTGTAANEDGTLPIEIWTSSQGTFTILAITNGMACILFAGKDWATGTLKPEDMPPAPQSYPDGRNPNAALFLIHSWYTGLQNEQGQICCGGTDCGPLADSEVTPVPGGYQVHTKDFAPKHIKIDAFVPNARAKPAKEGGEYSLCYWGGEVKCFWFPAPSF